MKKTEKKDEALEILAADVSQVRWAIGLKTNIGGINDWQSNIANARDSFAAEHARLKLKQSAANTAGGRALKKPTVTRATLETFREEFIYRMGSERGWVKAARLQFGVTENTIRARMKENE